MTDLRPPDTETYATTERTRVRRSPKRIPDAHSSTLFGPGVTALTNENAARPASPTIDSTFRR